jgi:hypothetical protein
LVVNTGSNAQSGITIVSETNKQGMFAFADGTSGDQRYRGAIDYNHSNDSMAFLAAGSERMRINSDGSLDIGGFGTTGTVDGVRINGDGAGIQSKGASAGFHYHNRFYNSNNQVGYIGTQNSSTVYVTSSDYRLKTDAQPMVGATARVQALNPVNFEWIADGTRTDGFLAHEAQAIVPEAVTGTKDAMRDEEYEVTAAVIDENGTETTAAVMGTRSVPDHQGIDQSKIVPLLTAALREALTKIDDMETRLAALEAN